MVFTTASVAITYRIPQRMVNLEDIRYIILLSADIKSLEIVIRGNK